MTSKKNELMDNELDQVAGGIQQAAASAPNAAGGTEDGGLLGKRIPLPPLQGSQLSSTKEGGPLGRRRFLPIDEEGYEKVTW